MNLRHLRIFLMVSEMGSMTRAGKELYMAQPTVSQAIAELEKMYDTRLFERLNHRLYLTAAGEHLQAYARHILSLADQAQKDLADLNQGGAIRIGASLTVGAYLLPDLVAWYQQKYPEVEIFTLVDNTTLIEKKLLEDHLDLGIVEGPVVSSHIIEKTYCDDHLVLIVSPKHPLAHLPSVTIQELANQRFIVREAGSGTQAIFEHAMHAAEANWKVVGIYNNFEAIKQAVIANLGIAVVSRIAIADEVSQGRLVSLPVQGISLKRKFNLVYHRQKFFTRAMQTFLDASLDFMESHREKME